MILDCFAIKAKQSRFFLQEPLYFKKAESFKQLHLPTNT